MLLRPYYQETIYKSICNQFSSEKQVVTYNLFAHDYSITKIYFQIQVINIAFLLVLKIKPNGKL